MKPPCEWWMSDYGDDGDWHQSDDGGIRYLRADLTCGECANIDIETFSTPWCKWRGVATGTGLPACMAFVQNVVSD